MLPCCTKNQHVHVVQTKRCDNWYTSMQIKKINSVPVKEDKLWCFLFMCCSRYFMRDQILSQHFLILEPCCLMVVIWVTTSRHLDTFWTMPLVWRSLVCNTARYFSFSWCIMFHSLTLLIFLHEHCLLSKASRRFQEKEKNWASKEDICKMSGNTNFPVSKLEVDWN
jgi:hypothetical protein